jgi:acyl-CoA synthetase (AMP-forming)/AMP-acid ligase II
MLIHERFFDVASRFADRPFVGTPPNPERIWEPAGLQYSYAQAAARIGEIARIYRDAGIGHGHRVATEIENHPDYFLHKLALSTLGASIVPLNPDMKRPELAWALELTAPEHVLVLPHLRARVAAGAAELGKHAPCLVDFAAFDRGLPGVRRQAPESGAIDTNTETQVLFTSGTTGRSKGCRYSHDYEIALGDWYASMGGMAALRPGVECVYNPLPVYHSDCGIRAFHEMMIHGGALFTSDRFRPTRFWDDVRASKATVIHYLGIVTAFLMAQPELPSDREHQVRFALGAGVEPSRQDYFETRFGFPLLEMWGMTECMRVLCDCLPPRTLGKRAVGRPRPGLEVKLVDDNEEEVPVGQQGEMCIRHSESTPRKGVFSGYIDDPAATEHAWRGGWFHTGDTLRQDESGCLFFVDRKKNIIRRSGENIAAVEVEGILGKHPRVAQCAVIAVKDELREEEVFACVVPHASEGTGEAERAALVESLLAFGSESLAYHKLPGWLLFMDDIPKTASQKMMKYAIFPPDVDPRQLPGVLDLRDRKKRLRA